MTPFKCKLCGGDILADAGQGFGKCDSCGTTTTLPKASDEQKVNLHNRADHYRRKSDFDQAIKAYENILNIDNTDAEAHWGLALSKFGIEYVKDPATHSLMPTCNRLQRESILSDFDYLAALEHAPDGYTRSLYEEEAKRISEMQKRILAISIKEEPYDVFICYKEATDGGSRTKDSAIAQDIYYRLVSEGCKVFFSRITLEEKLGQEYEPYIFAALNSAKVMLAIGTKSEHFNAPWVKNEWSRFLALIKKDGNRLLIPCYQDMDPYDLPGELSMLQCQDMSKIGFVQDLVRGIKKVLDKKDQAIAAAPVPPAAPQGPSPADSMLRRAFIVLEDEDWEKASELLERVLDIEPENSRAYIGKLMVKLKLRFENQLSAKAVSENIKSLAEFKDYEKAMRFADTEYRGVLESYEEQRKEIIYQRAKKEMEKITSASDIKYYVNNFSPINGYKDSNALIKQCREIYKEKVYRLFCTQIQTISNASELNSISNIIAIADLSGYKDADALLEKCIEPFETQYIKAQAAMDRAAETKVPKDFEFAAGHFFLVPGYRDADSKYEKCLHEARYYMAHDAMKNKNYKIATSIFSSLGTYRDSRPLALKCQNLAKRKRKLNCCLWILLIPFGLFIIGIFGATIDACDKLQETIPAPPVGTSPAPPAQPKDQKKDGEGAEDQKKDTGETKDKKKNGPGYP